MKVSEPASLERTQKGWMQNGRRMQRAIGVATLRRDGFVSLDAGSQGGTLETRPIAATGGRLEVNADVSGELRVEAAEPSGAAIPGYEASACRPMTGDRLTHVVGWSGRPDLGALRGRSIVPRFLLRSGRLYGFGSAPTGAGAGR
jgi:hypothetical protein